MQQGFSEPVGSFKVFANKLIDYAGIFPPASLSLAQAFHNYLFYQEGFYSWMLSNFICPAGKLSELTGLMKHVLGDRNSIVPLSVIGSSGNNLKQTLGNFETDIRLIDEFNKLHSSHASVNAYELRLPDELSADSGAGKMLDTLDKINYTLQETLKQAVPCFFEAALTNDFHYCISKIAEVTAVHNLKGFNCGLKLRTGGTEAAAFPSVEQVAYTIFTCLEQKIPMKCTAGLHHPVRHYNESVSAKMHGFLNVFGAGILGYTHSLEQKQLIEIIEDEYSYNFDFSLDGFVWNGVTVSEEKIHEAREKLMISYGSCSFDEPIDDLKTIELL